MAFMSTNFSGFLNEEERRAEEQGLVQSAGRGAAFGAEGGTPRCTDLPPAPAGPSSHDVVHTTMRATTILPTSSTIDPASVGAVLADPKLPPGFTELVVLTGAVDATPLSLFFDIPESDWKDMLEAVTIDEMQVAPIQRAALIQYLRKLFSENGLEPPNLGGAKRARPAEAAAPPGNYKLSAGSSADGAHPPTPTELTAELVAINKVVDQSVKGQVKSLTFTELAQYRNFYERVTGGPPPEESLPSADQLAGLKSILDAGRVPFVDFAVWSSLGPRMSKFRRTEASVFVGGELVTKTLEGPSNFAGWEESWSLFAVAMISLNAATPGSLQAYHAGIKHLLRLFPSKWGTIAAVDLVARSERWTRLREDFERSSPSAFSTRMPWDLVIRASAFNQDGTYGNWWHLNFVLPATVSQPSPAAEGIPRTGGGDKSKPPPAPKAPAHFVRNRAGGREICSNYNNRHGDCAGDGACPAGRLHSCNVCPKQHRACDHHSSNRFFAGNGKGNKGGKGKGKGHKKGRGQSHADA